MRGALGGPGTLRLGGGMETLGAVLRTPSCHSCGLHTGWSWHHAAAPPAACSRSLWLTLPPPCCVASSSQRPVHLLRQEGDPEHRQREAGALKRGKGGAL